MKSSPLLFKAEMVRALLRGLDPKTQTRRTRGLEMVNKSPDEWDIVYQWPSGDGLSFGAQFDCGSESEWLECPLGGPGDRIWVRETWALRGSAADMTAKEIRETTHKDILRDDLVYRADSDGYDAASQGWRPSIFMPRWASRITLELTAVRVEQLNSISEADAKAEGCDPEKDLAGKGAQVQQRYAALCSHDTGGYRLAYMHLWESINGKNSWNLNPYVWVYSFQRIK